MQPLSPLQEFSYNRKEGNATLFRPNGSFDSLREQGKLRDSKNEDEEGARDVMREKKFRMPGYTGFIRGSQHISGRTYGEKTRRAYDTNFGELVCTSPIPSAPQGNRKITQKHLEDTFVDNNLSHRHNHVPGYTGHVPGVRATYSKTFGEATMQEMKTFGATYPRPSPADREGFAATIRPRDLLSVDSAPLPGTTYIHSAPVKLIPGHLKYLKFFAI